MADDALRRKWTDSNLDSLNSGAKRRLQMLDHNIRGIRTDIACLTAETARDVDELNGVRHSEESFNDQRSFEWQTPEPDVRLGWGEGWSDERIADLCSEVSEGVALADDELDCLQREIEVARSELNARFNALVLSRLRRLAAGRSPAPQRCRGRTRAGTVAIHLRGSWSDGRLDDLNHSIDLALVRLECGIVELRGEVTALRKEMQGRRRAHSAARFRVRMWRLYAVWAMVCLAIILNGALAAALAP